MWISKKEWADLLDENFALKKKIEELEQIDSVIKNVKTNGKVFCVNTEYFLVDVHHYYGLISDLNTSRKKLNEFRKELEKYKQLYLDELQKRLELAEMVRKMDGD